jgi:hypothetical protein
VCFCVEKAFRKIVFGGKCASKAAGFLSKGAENFADKQKVMRNYLQVSSN